MFKNTFQWGFFSLLLCLPLSAADKKPLPLESFSGVWASKRYLHSLHDRRTTLELPPEEFTIRKGKDNASWYFAWSNFHESIEYEIASFRREKPNIYEIKLSDSLKPTCHMRVTRDAAGTLLFVDFEEASCVSTNEKLPFERISDSLPIYATKRLLVGEYRDSEGISYSFTESGQARMGDIQFPFALSLDKSETNCDNYFYRKDAKNLLSPNAFGFRWNTLELQLFKIVATAEVPLACEDDPFISLTRVEGDRGIGPR